MRTALAALALSLAAPALAAPVSPVLANATGKPIVRRLGLGNDISMVLVSSQGTSVFLDPRNTKLVPDLAAVTHDHHLDKAFVAAAQGAKLLVATPGTVEAKGVKITGIAASHGPYPVKSPPDYVILLVELDGLRVAYLPCTNQKEFTPEQRAALGKVDVLLLTAENETGGRNVQAFFALARQVQPKIILTLSHHVTDYETALEDLGDAAGVPVETVKDPLVLDAAALGQGKLRLVNLLATAPSQESVTTPAGRP
jgi:hypothetical protein